jgi:hypothetical protein
MEKEENQYKNRLGVLINDASMIDQDVVWTTTPNAIRNIRVEKKSEELTINLNIKGLQEDNFKVTLAGNVLGIVLEKKREFILANSWGNTFHPATIENHIYSIFERSDLILPGHTEKHLKSVRFIENELVIKIKNHIRKGFAA